MMVLRLPTHGKVGFTFFYMIIIYLIHHVDVVGQVAFFRFIDFKMSK